MKREEKNAQARQKILDAAMREFSQKGYEGASLSAACAQNGISKGIVYHHFKDKDELYLLCIRACFDALTAYLQAAYVGQTGTAAQRLTAYFDARLRFFAQEPLMMGLFAHAAISPPSHLYAEMAKARAALDALNVEILTELLGSMPLRPPLTVDVVTEDFKMYIDDFNARFIKLREEPGSMEEALKKHEERCHRQLDMLLYGVWVNDHE